MIEEIKKIDEILFLWLNAFHIDWLDPVVFQLTKTITWTPFYLFLLFKIYKTDPKNRWWIYGGLALTILLADQFTSGFMKPFFERLRPCHDERWTEQIHNYGRCGGLYGFVSSHAANTFAVAVYLNLKMNGKLRHLKWLYLWAGIVSYTRIYLGVHYPFDVILGAIIGAIIAVFAWFLIVVVKRQLVKKVLY
jgi:undecaprenyl-diphosphatase